MRNHSILALAIIALLAGTAAEAKYSGGTGEPNNPYQIATKADLLALGANTADYGKCFILTADIDLDPNLPGGQVFTTAIIAPDMDNSNGYNFDGTAFTGTFDGNNHNIANFTINGESNNDYLGLFGYVSSGGSVKNLGLENCAVSGCGYAGGLVGVNSYGSISNCYSTGSVICADFLGGLVGENFYGTISNCYSTGAVSGCGWVGGLVGWNDLGTISNCYSTGSVSGNEYVGGLVGENDLGSISSCYSTGAVSGDSCSTYIGGLVGWNDLGTISNCYSTGLVSGNFWVGGLVGGTYLDTISNCYSTGSVSSGGSYIGGLVGANGGSISNCYSTGSVSGYRDVGGLVGENGGSIGDCYSTGAVSGIFQYVGGLVGGYGGGAVDSFWDVNTSGQTTSAGGTGLNTLQMKQRVSFTGWDFTTIWAICEGTNYPRLRWQIPVADWVCPEGVDFVDFAILASAWQTEPNDAGWNPICDISQPKDNVIDERDLAVFCENWLEGTGP